MSNKKDKINHWVIVLGWLHMGGAERQALHLARQLIIRGEKVSVVGISTPGIVKDICAAENIPCYYWPTTLSRSPLRAMKTGVHFGVKLLRMRPTYILPYCMPPNVLCGIVWRMTGAKSCVWQQRDEGRLRRGDWLEFMALLLMPKYISNSEHGSEWLNTVLHVRKDLITVIPNGTELVKIENTKGLWKKEWGIPKDTQIVTMVANLHAYKDHMTLLKAWNLLKNKWVEKAPLLILAGNKDSAYAELHSYVKENDMSGTVLFVGSIPDVTNLLADTDLFVLSSKNEGVPNGILEAMAVGLPVIATDIPGNREALSPNIVHQLSIADQPDDLAKKIYNLLMNRTLMNALGMANKELVRKRNSIEQMVDKTVKVFLDSHKY